MTTVEPVEEMKRAQAEADLELAAWLFGLIEGQMTRADTKAGLVVAADSVFATALLLAYRGTIFLIFDPAASVPERLAGLLTIFLFFAILASTLFALIAARPALKAHRDDEGTIFFFGRISQMAHADYLEAFNSSHPKQLRHAILTEVHNTSQIATRKFKRIRYSLDFLIVGVLLWGAIQILLALSPR